MIRLYWDIGRSIAEKQKSFGWGTKVVEMAAADLKRELPDTNGFSRTNLFEMRKFYLFYVSNQIVHQAAGQLKNDTEETESEIVLQDGGLPENEQNSIPNEIVHQAGGQLESKSILTKVPWRHHVVILNKCSKINEAGFYIKQTILNNWSRSILELQIASKLIDRQGKAQNNYKLTLPKTQSDLANETLKDPFKFDFLTLENNVQELELERKLTENIMLFLLELGKGFAFVGRQYPLKIGNKERKIDLLFYHLKMHCYVVIDLKTGEFEPEHAGKMNYYLSAVDDLLKSVIDHPSI